MKQANSVIITVTGGMKQTNSIIITVTGDNRNEAS